MIKKITIISIVVFFVWVTVAPVVIGENGTTYYVDATNGNDSNNGLSLSNAWKTIAKVNKESFSPSDSILFKRGETWRGRLTIPSSGNQGAPITFGAYGTGDKPLILGSISKNGVNDWINLGDNLWATSDGSFPSDVGFIMFGEEKSDNVGLKCEQQSDIDDDKEYWYDQDGGRVVLYCEQNPADQYSTIELAYSNHLMEHLISAKNYGVNISYVTIENLQLKYFNSHGIQLVNSQGITIRNCDITYGGGEQYEDTELRVGNGIEFWENAHDCVVEGCKIGEIWDAAVTNQGTDTNEQHNITYKNNIIWNSEYSFEIWDRPESSTMNDVYVEDNVCVAAGFGWSHKQRPDPHGWHLALWGNHASTDNIYIHNNVFYEAAFSSLYFDTSETEYESYGLVSDNNYYYQDSGYMMVHKYDKAYTMNQFSIYQSDKDQDLNSVTGDKGIVKETARSMVSSQDEINLLNELFITTDTLEPTKNEGVTLEGAEFDVVDEQQDQEQDQESDLDKETPGFEILLLLTAMIIIYIKKRKNKD